MIDEEWLRSCEEMMRLHPDGTHAVFSGRRNHGAWMLDESSILELIRLARIGLAELEKQK